MQSSEARWILSLEALEPSMADELAVRDAALSRVALFEQQFSIDGMISLLGEGMLAEAASWTPMLKRTACAPDEVERHEVYDGGQHVGTISRRKGFRNEPDRHTAFSVNGRRVTDYNTTSRQDALKAIQTHLEEAPARVIAMPAANKFLVAQPSSYSGEVSYKAYPNEQAARQAAGLPAQPTVPERNSKVEAVAELLRFDLMTVSGLNIGPLARVQEARRRDPFDLVAEAFDPGELRNFRGEWAGGALKRLEDLPQIDPKELGASVGEGPWSKAAAGVVKDVLAGRVEDTEHAYRLGGRSGNMRSYSPERIQLHQAIIQRLFAGKKRHPGSARAIFTAGGPASGKSELVNGGHLGLPGDTVRIDPDLIKEMLPEYKPLQDAGRADAASKVHEEASHIAKLATALALEHDHHVLIDSVGDSEPGKFAGKIKDAQRAGHKVSVAYATSSVKSALAHAQERFVRSKRSVPEAYLRSAHRDVSRLYEREVQHLPGVHLRVFDTTVKGKPRLLAEKHPSDKLVIKDRVGYKRFLAKGRARL